MKLTLMNSPMKRTSPVLFSMKKELKASATVEALMVIPIVFAFVYLFIWLLDVIRVHSMIGEIVNEAGRSIVAMSPIENVSGTLDMNDAEQLAASIGVSIITDVYLKEKIEKSSVGDEIRDVFCFMSSTESDAVSIDVYYTVAPKLNLPGIKGMILTNAFYSKKYVGFSGETEITEYVYITKESKVYHTSNECSALKTTIQTLSYDSLDKARNTDKGKYYPCTKCVDGASSMVYVTPHGNRYHNAADCPELRIHVYKIPIDEVGERRLCSYCK